MVILVRETKNLRWLSNVVLVPKHNGKWRMSVDFTDLNKATPKGLHPMPNIDKLVNNTYDYATLSFLDSFSGNNQIK